MSTPSQPQPGAGSDTTADDGFLADVDVRRLSLYATLLLFVAFYLSPLEAGLMTAFKTNQAFFSSSPFAPPGAGGFTLDAWFQAWGEMQGALTNTNGALFNSLSMAVPAAVLSAVFGSLTAYGLTNVDWRGQAAVLMLLVAGVFIPYQAVLVPLTQFWTMIGIRELVAGIPFLAERPGLVALSLTHAAYGIPICTVLFRAYYATLDEEMLEAARLDGAGVARSYLRIVLPLSGPMFAVTLIYQFTNIWNDLLFALVLVTSNQNQVITVALNSLSGSFVTQFNVQMAGAFIAAAPTLLVYILFGEQFAEGVAT
jgi:glucose/mannose transport system permease protein